MDLEKIVNKTRRKGLVRREFAELFHNFSASLGMAILMACVFWLAYAWMIHGASPAMKIAASVIAGGLILVAAFT